MLHLTNTQVSDITPLEALPKLETLHIAGTPAEAAGAKSRFPEQEE